MTLLEPFVKVVSSKSAQANARVIKAIHQHIFQKITYADVDLALVGNALFQTVAKGTLPTEATDAIWQSILHIEKEAKKFGRKVDFKTEEV